MFDLGAAELLVIVIVAIIVIGPKDMPRAMRTAGRWIGKVRKVSAHFRTGLDAMVREAELEDMEKKWQEQNEAIMKRSSGVGAESAGGPAMTGPPPTKPRTVATPAEPKPEVEPSRAESASPKPESASAAAKAKASEPELPLGSDGSAKPREGGEQS